MCFCDCKLPVNRKESRTECRNVKYLSNTLERAKTFSVYLRPWTLSKKFATAQVPFLADIGAVQKIDALQEPKAESTPSEGQIANNIRNTWK